MSVRLAAVYVAITLVLAYPLSRHPASQVISAAPDTDLFMWTLAWDAHAFSHPFTVLPHIFDLFFTTKLGQGGSGLGLHIVYATVTTLLS